MKRKVRVYKPTAQQGMQQQAPNPELLVGTVVNSLSSTMDEEGNIIEDTLKEIRSSLELQYGAEFANEVIQKALNQIYVDKPKKTSTEPAAPQAMIDPNYNPFAEQEAMNQQIMNEALTETPVDLVARRGLQIYQDQGETMGDFYDTYETRPEVGQPIVSYDPMRDNPPATPLTTFIGNSSLSPEEDPLFSQQKLDYLAAMGALPTQNYRPPGYFSDDERTSIEQQVKNINEATAAEQSLNPQKVGGIKGEGITKKQYAKNIMNYMKQAGGMSDAEMVDNTDTLNGREQINSNFINTLNNQSQIGAVNEFAEDTYEEFARGGQQRRAMRRANRAMRRAGKAMRGMPMMPGFMQMPMTPFGPMNPFVNQFFPVNATASTNINPYGIRSIERYGRGLFRRPKTTVNFFNPYDFIDRGVVDAETVDTVTETPIDGNNDSVDSKVQDQAKTNTEVKQVETHSQKKGKGADSKKAKEEAEELDRSNTATTSMTGLAEISRDYANSMEARVGKRPGDPAPRTLTKSLPGYNESIPESNFDPFFGDGVRVMSDFERQQAGMNGPWNNWGDGPVDMLDDEWIAGVATATAPLSIGTGALSQFGLKAIPKGFLPGARMLPGARSLGTGSMRYLPQGAGRFLNPGQAMLNAGQRLLPAGPMQFGGFVSPELYEFIYGAEKKKAIDFELPEAQSGFWIGSNQGRSPIYDKRTQAPNFIGSLMFGPEAAGLKNPFKYAGSYIKYKGSKGDNIGQPITSISEKEDLKGRGKKWEITRGADAPRRTRIKKDQQMPQFTDMNAPMTDEQYIEMMQGDQPGRRRAADFFYKLGQKSGLNPEKNLFTKIGTKLEPDRDFSTVEKTSETPEVPAPDSSTAPQNLQTRSASAIPTADEMNIMQMDPTPGMEPLANAINIEAPYANKYIQSDPSLGQIDPADSEEAKRLKREAASRRQLATYSRLAGVMDSDENLAKMQKHMNRLYGPGSTAFDEIASSTYSDIPEEQMLLNPDFEAAAPNVDISNLSGQDFGMSNRNPMLPPITGVDPAQEFVQINEDYIPGYGPRDFGARPESIIDMAAIQQGQDYDRQSAYEDYIRRSMDAQDMTQRGLYGQDLIDQEFANRDDWFTVGIPQIKSNQARRARQRADIASESFSTKPVIRGEGVGDLGLKKTPPGYETPDRNISYDQYYQDPTDYAVEAAMTDYSSIPDEEFWTDYSPTIQSLVSQERMESDPILKEALRRDIYNLHRESAIRSAALARTNRTNKDFRDEYLRALTPEQLKDFFAARQTGGALNQYQGSQASQVTSVQDGSAYPGALAIGDYESPMVAFMNQGNPEIPYDQPVQYETNEYMGGDGTPQEEITPILGPKYKEKYKRKDIYDFDGAAFNNILNVAGNAAASLFEKQGMNWQNFSSDEMTQAQRSTDKLDYETLTGLLRPDEKGSDLTMQAKKGGTYKENQVTYLSEDQIKEIIDNGGEIEFV